ncbi:hypothetical protein DACRYDRAFT_106335 [Dacryopinax primogenitus]|uniref:Uncharacterized protein n=1 Tax=Dacryopinax primogenitus (strain DJM 731) TaxID=1858805 RepID=M5G393_DACPD|nr:uncharacterized protein DACRYDRAFT_106335 [Dacryopinax primogenitus]EJU03164.1 hypothetical protein DACRYDRAFT_106335 [Dacryopinax primogenitus]
MATRGSAPSFRPWDTLPNEVLLEIFRLIPTSYSISARLLQKIVTVWGATLKRLDLLTTLQIHPDDLALFLTRLSALEACVLTGVGQPFRSEGEKMSMADLVVQSDRDCAVTMPRLRALALLHYPMGDDDEFDEECGWYDQYVDGNQLDAENMSIDNARLQYLPAAHLNGWVILCLRELSITLPVAAYPTAEIAETSLEKLLLPQAPPSE